MTENIDHPSHYNQGKIEVIDFIEDQEFCFHLGNAVKYICRAGRKDPDKWKEDIRKSIWYLERFMKNTGEAIKEIEDDSTVHDPSEDRGPFKYIRIPKDAVIKTKDDYATPFYEFTVSWSSKSPDVRTMEM